jgi:hypothetical protein
MACACARSPGGPLTACPTSYNCCFTIASGGSQGCLCSTANTAAECTQAAGILGGTVVTRCPP